MVQNEELAAVRERLARLEEQAENQAARMDIVQRDIRAIRSALDQMNGGKRLLLGIFAAIGALVTAAAAIVGIVKAIGHP